VIPLSLSGQRQHNGEQGGASVVRRRLQVTKEIARVRASKKRTSSRFDPSQRLGLLATGVLGAA